MGFAKFIIDRRIVNPDSTTHTNRLTITRLRLLYDSVSRRLSSSRGLRIDLAEVPTRYGVRDLDIPFPAKPVTRTEHLTKVAETIDQPVRSPAPDRPKQG
jgi:hypothetical protein